MTGIYASGGMQTPTFQPANSKGDGGGNGSGGMFFGQAPEEEQQPLDYNYDYFPAVDTQDIPYQLPTYGSKPDALASWKIALATNLYNSIRGIAPEPIEY